MTTIGLGPLRFRLNWRVVMVCALLAAGTVVAFTFSVSYGDFPLTFTDVWRILSGGGTKIEKRIVIDVRLGRALVAILIGAALAFSGALTQSVARNPLASPDVLGVTQGASLAAVIALAFAGDGTAAGGLLHSVGLPLAAFVGALAVAAAVWLIAGDSKNSIVRFVLIGVAASTLCSSLITWVMAVGDLDRVAGARLWLTGSLNGQDVSGVAAPLAVVLAALCLAAYLSFQLEALVLGELTATVLGHNVRISQAVHLIVAVALAAVAVSAAGPVGFVAFASPQIALRLAGTPTPPLVTSALIGAFLVSAADLAARVLLPWELPVGIITTVCGAPVLIYLVITLNRKASA